MKKNAHKIYEKTFIVGFPLKIKNLNVPSNPVLFPVRQKKVKSFLFPMPLVRSAHRGERGVCTLVYHSHTYN